MGPAAVLQPHSSTGSLAPRVWQNRRSLPQRSMQHATALACCHAFTQQQQQHPSTQSGVRWVPITQLCCHLRRICTLTAGDSTSASNNKAEPVSQPPSELFRSGELSFGTFGDEPAGEVRNRDSSCIADMHSPAARVALATVSFQVHAKQNGCMHARWLWHK